MNDLWRLPSGITDLSPKQASQLHNVSRALIANYQSKGYQLVLPPIVEYEAAHLYQIDDVFKTLDPVDGRMLTIHSDITPQIARIDAKYTKNAEIGRYCYIADILNVRSDDFYASRNPIQAGAELYGSDTYLADLEVIELMLDSLRQINLSHGLILSLGHIGVMNSLISVANFNPMQLVQFKSIINYRSKQDLINFFKINPTDIESDIVDLLSLKGGTEVLEKAKDRYHNNISIIKILTTLTNLVNQLDLSDTELHIDLANLKDKSYYTGLLFTCYHSNYSKALAQGGRYDKLNNNSDYYRYATGFSLDLKFLSSHFNDTENDTVLYHPMRMDVDLIRFIKTLRSQGRVVIMQLSEADICSFEYVDGCWRIKE